MHFKLSLGEDHKAEDEWFSIADDLKAQHQNEIIDECRYDFMAENWQLIKDIHDIEEDLEEIPIAEYDEYVNIIFEYEEASEVE